MIKYDNSLKNVSKVAADTSSPKFDDGDDDDEVGVEVVVGVGIGAGADVGVGIDVDGHGEEGGIELQFEEIDPQVDCDVSDSLTTRLRVGETEVIVEESDGDGDGDLGGDVGEVDRGSCGFLLGDGDEGGGLGDGLGELLPGDMVVVVVEVVEVLVEEV